MLLLALTACQHNPAADNVDFPRNPGNPASRNFLIGSFNLHNFGPKRLENTGAMQLLTRILSRYDLVVLMEIVDSSGDAIAELHSQLNALDMTRQYALELSNRLGRGRRKEQYAILYRPDRVSLSDIYEYDDGVEPDHDLFSREPLVAHADFGGITLTLIILHADPENVLFELNRLIPVYEDAVIREGDPDAIILGDLNADCGFLADRDAPFVKLLRDERFVWLIGKDQDTTVRQTTDCAYDRIIVTKTLAPALGDKAASIFDFSDAYGLDESQALEVSDHFPVEVELTAQTVSP